MVSGIQIPSHVASCGRHFCNLIKALPNAPRFVAQMKPGAINDEFDRFKVWAGNIAAHRKGRRSLENRLRDAPHLKDETCNLLTALQDSLQNALAIVSGERIPWDESAESDTESESDAEDTALASDTELKLLLESIKNTITCLFRLSIAIRDPAPEIQFRSTIIVDKSHFHKHDIRHVEEKFKLGKRYLIDRLGVAISGRRSYLTYREEHNQKLSKHLEVIGIEEPHTEHTNSTEATPMLAVSSVSKGMNAIDDGEDILSQTSYATTVKNTSLRVPRLPKEAQEQEHFECPLCFVIVSIHTYSEWKQHVFRDLHPYCCTFEDCATADRLYDSRHAWFKHELEAHRAIWQCIAGCEKTFALEEDFVAHIGKKHPEMASDDILSILKRTAVKSANLTKPSQCPLCDKVMSLRALQKHLGNHQEQLALFALPPNIDSTDDEVEDTAALAEAAKKAMEEAKAKAAEEAKRAQDEADMAIAEPKAAAEADKARKKAEEETAKVKPSPDEQESLIRFKDAVGRKFSFPWHLCKTWKGMEGLIEQAFLHVDIIGPHVREGHYDLVGPDGEIILPQVWETVVQPDWSITMHMWPMPEPTASVEATKKAIEEAKAKATEEAKKTKEEAEEVIAETIAVVEEADKPRKAAEDEAAKVKLKPDERKPPIRFKDAVGRKFSFPWHVCKTWKGMEGLIEQAFLHVDIIGPHVHEGHYDLVGPDGEIILPQVWEAVVQPGWSITMHMWPMSPPPHRPAPPAQSRAAKTRSPFLAWTAGGGKNKAHSGAAPPAGAVKPHPPPPSHLAAPPAPAGTAKPPPPPAEVVKTPPPPAGAMKPSPFLAWTAGGAKSQSLKRSKNT